MTDTTVSRRLVFNIQFHPGYGQELQQFVYTVDVTPCRTQTLSVPVQPPNLVISRSYTALNSVEFNINPTYKDLLVSTYPSDCQVLRLEFLNEDGTAPIGGGRRLQSSSPVSMSDQNDPNAAKLHVTNDRGFSITVRI